MQALEAYAKAQAPSLCCFEHLRPFHIACVTSKLYGNVKNLDVFREGWWNYIIS